MYTTIIASRAGEPLLRETLESIAAQTLPAERVLVVCDTRDAIPRDWATELRAVCPTVEFSLNPAVGQVSALNWGIAKSTTPYLAFLDSDDLWQPDKQRRQIELLQQDRGLDAAYCFAANFNEHDDGTTTVDASVPSIMFTCTTFRREAFDRFGRLDPASTHFTWLYRWWGPAKERGIATECVDYVGLHRRLHSGNSWTVQRRSAHRDLLAEVRRHAGQMRQASTTSSQGDVEVPSE